MPCPLCLLQGWSMLLASPRSSLAPPPGLQPIPVLASMHDNQKPAWALLMDGHCNDGQALSVTDSWTDLPRPGR